MSKSDGSPSRKERSTYIGRWTCVSGVQLWAMRTRFLLLSLAWGRVWTSKRPLQHARHRVLAKVDCIEVANLQESGESSGVQDLHNVRPTSRPQGCPKAVQSEMRESEERHR